MQVKDLIELLAGYDPEAEVHFTYNYGDHWRTQVAPKVRDIDVGYVKFSDYHRMDKVWEPDYDEDDETDADKLQEVVLIGG